MKSYKVGVTLPLLSYTVIVIQSIDIKNETINLDNCVDTDAGTLNSRFPSDHARYHLFLYKHSHEGDYLESIGM